MFRSLLQTSKVFKMYYHSCRIYFFQLEFDEVMKRAYDQFNLKLSNVQLFFANPGENIIIMDLCITSLQKVRIFYTNTDQSLPII